MATRAQIAAARRNIKKAQAALRRKHGAPRRRRRRAREDDPRRRRRRRRVAEEGVIRRSRRSGRFTRRRRGSRIAGRVDEAPRRRRRRRVRDEAPRRRRRRRAREDEIMLYEDPRRRRRRRRRARIMENPMGLWESIGGFLGGTAGFIGADLADRGIATREKSPIRDVQTPIYKSGWRLAAGAGLTVVPIGIAAFVRGATLRSVLQLFGYGAGIRTIGKVVIDGVAKASAETATGQRLFTGELAAQSLLRAAEKEKAGTTAGLPRGMGAVACPTCGRRDGLGICCKAYGVPSAPSPSALMAQPQVRCPPEFPSPSALLEKPGECPPSPSSQLREPRARVPGEEAPPAPAAGAFPAAFAPALIPAAAGVRGLGHAADQIIQAARALSANRATVEAVAQGRATPAEKRSYDELMAAHAPAIRTISQGVAGLSSTSFNPRTIYNQEG